MKRAHLHRIQGEMDAHREALAGAPDVATAQTACTAHPEQMNDIFDAMGQSLGDMGCL